MNSKIFNATQTVMDWLIARPLISAWRYVIIPTADVLHSGLKYPLRVALAMAFAVLGTMALAKAAGVDVSLSPQTIAAAHAMPAAGIERKMPVLPGGEVKQANCLDILHKHVERCTPLEITMSAIMEHETAGTFSPLAVHFDKCEWRNAAGKCRLNENRAYGSPEKAIKVIEAARFLGIVDDTFGVGCGQVTINWQKDKVQDWRQAFDAERNVKLSLQILAEKFKRFPNDYRQAVGAYNTANRNAAQARYLSRVMPLIERNQARCLQKQLAAVEK